MRQLSGDVKIRENKLVEYTFNYHHLGNLKLNSTYYIEVSVLISCRVFLTDAPAMARVNVEPNVNKKDRELLEPKKQQFSYSEILIITNNFEQRIGKGGFGSVYLGYLNDTQVAVKMLSRSSRQGYKQFHAEVIEKLTLD